MNFPLLPSTDFSEIWVQFILPHTLLFFQELQQHPMIKIQKESQINAPTTAQHILCSSWGITPRSHIITSKIVAVPLTMCTVSWWGFQSSWTHWWKDKVLDILFFTKSGNKICATGRKIRYYILTQCTALSRIQSQMLGKLGGLAKELLCYLSGTWFFQKGIERNWNAQV